MITMKRINYYISILLCFTVLLLTSCTETDVPVSEVSVETSGTVTIQWWSFPVFAQENEEESTGSYEKKLIQTFEAKHPDIKVQLKMIDFTTGPEKVEIAIANDSAPDVLLDAPGRIVDYGHRGYMMNLNGMFDDAFVKDVNNDALIQACKDGDIPYVYPLSSAPFYMVFNYDMVQDAGVLDLVKEGWTTDDFIQVTKALSEAGYAPGSLFCKDSGGDQGTRAFAMNLSSGSVLNDSLSAYQVADPKGIEGLSTVKACLDKGYIVDGSMYNGTDDIQNLVNGHSSYSLLWSLGMDKTYQSRLEANGIRLLEVPYPSNDGHADLEYLVNGFGIFKNKDETKMEAAKTFVDFMCNDSVYGPQNVIQTGAIPVRTSFGDLYDDTRLKTLSTWKKYYTTYYNTVSGFMSMRTYWYHMLQSMIHGDKSPKLVAQYFVKLANQSLKGEAK